MVNSFIGAELYTYYGCLFASPGELRSWETECMASKFKIFATWPFTETVYPGIKTFAISVKRISDPIASTLMLPDFLLWGPHQRLASSVEHSFFRSLIFLIFAIPAPWWKLSTIPSSCDGKAKEKSLEICDPTQWFRNQGTTSGSHPLLSLIWVHNRDPVESRWPSWDMQKSGNLTLIYFRI